MTNGRVLIVDDERLNRLLLSTNLVGLGYSVEVAESGEQALALLHEKPFDVVLLDLMMPGLDGYEVLERLKADATLRHVPVIVISSMQEMTSIIRCIELGATDYLPKPFNPTLLRARLTASLAHKRLYDAEQEYLQTLRAHNAELDAFTHTVAHDLKQPLGAILGYGELLLADYSLLSDEERQQDISRMVQAAHRMNRIIHELLLLATVRKEEVHIGPFAMKLCVTEVLERLAFTIESQKPTLKVAEGWPRVVGYAPWVEEVWANYLSNALKYGGQPATIELGFSVNGRMGRFWVRDEGPGIPPDKQTHIFDPFTRLDHLPAEGQGLGLSIVKRIVSKLGGRVGVESEVGKGSRFWFELPLAPD